MNRFILAALLRSPHLAIVPTQTPTRCVCLSSLVSRTWSARMHGLRTASWRLNTAAITAALTAADAAFVHIQAFDLPPQKENLVLDTAGIVMLGELLARSYIEHP